MKLQVKTVIAICILTASVSTQAAVTSNGIALNGLKDNGIVLNGLKDNGIALNRTQSRNRFYGLSTKALAK